MRTLVFAALLALGLGALGPGAPAHAQLMLTGAGKNGPGGGGGDANTVLLLHFDAAKEFIDSSLAAHTVTSNAGVTRDTTNKKFGASSAAFARSDNNTVLLANSTDWTWTADWTVEMWVLNSDSSVDAQGRQRFISMGWQGSAPQLELLLNASGAVTLRTASADTTGSALVNDSAWHHVAAARSGSTAGLWVDGVSQGTQTVNGTFSYDTGAAGLGNESTFSTRFAGNIDEVRISKGTARYTPGTGFTPPSAAFSP